MSDQRYEPIDPEIEAILRDLDTDDLEQIDPPAALWDRIEAEIALDDAPPRDAAPGGEVIRLADRRRSRGVTYLAAVAAAVVVLVAGAAVVISRSDSSTTVVLTEESTDDEAFEEPAVSAVVATAELSYDETFDELGAAAVAGAELVENDDGSAEIRIVGATLPDPADEPADLELWLIEPDADGSVADLVSLGLVDPDAPGVYQVPAGYDPGTFFVVDISVEPRDGQPAHSGRSILRGPLVQV